MDAELLATNEVFVAERLQSVVVARRESSVGLGPDGRKRRLLQHFACNPIMILVGEAPSYQGCRFSGVPFTSQKVILAGRVPHIEERGRLTSRKLSFTERSATASGEC